MSSQHIHKYRRVDLGREKPFYVMQCQLPGCTHYVAMKTKLSCPALKGKVAKCNKCGDPFELNRRALRQAHPICNSCVESPKAEKIASAENFFQKLESGLKDNLE